MKGDCVKQVDVKGWFVRLPGVGKWPGWPCRRRVHRADRGPPLFRELYPGTVILATVLAGAEAIWIWALQQTMRYCVDPALA
jgi:hypothetical protein